MEITGPAPRMSNSLGVDAGSSREVLVVRFMSVAEVAGLPLVIAGGSGSRGPATHAEANEFLERAVL